MLDCSLPVSLCLSDAVRMLLGVVVESGSSDDRRGAGLAHRHKSGCFGGELLEALVPCASPSCCPHYTCN